MSQPSGTIEVVAEVANDTSITINIVSMHMLGKWDDVPMAGNDVPTTRNDVSMMITSDEARFMELRDKAWELNGMAPGVGIPQYDEELWDLYHDQAQVNLCRPDQIYMLFKRLRDITFSVRVQLIAEVKNQTEDRNRLSRELAASAGREDHLKEQLARESAEKLKHSREVQEQKIYYDSQMSQLKRIISSLYNDSTRLSSENNGLEQKIALFQSRRGEADDRVARLQNENEEMSKRAQKEKEEVTMRSQKAKAELNKNHAQEMVEMAQRHRESMDEIQKKMGQLQLSLKHCEVQKRAFEIQQVEAAQLLQKTCGEKESLAGDVLSLNSQLNLQARIFSDAQKRSDEEMKHLRKLLHERESEIQKSLDYWLTRETKLMEHCKSLTRVTKKRMLDELDLLDVQKTVSERFWISLTHEAGQPNCSVSPSMDLKLPTPPFIASPPSKSGLKLQ